MAGFSINSILNGVSQAPAGERMDVALIEHDRIRPNPENQKIYVIGNVDALKADILANGLRQPLEVIPAGDGGYILLGGERRWTALGQLVTEGQERFARVPCIVRESHGADDDLLALITANSTARELTDGERLAQYEALKRIYEKKKASGGLSGRVRDAMAEVLGVGAGTLGRLNAISEHCTNEVKAMLREGKTTLTRAYDASKLWPRQQAKYCRDGYAPKLPGVNDELYEKVRNWAAENLPFEGVDWMADDYYKCGFCDSLGKLEGRSFDMRNGLRAVLQPSRWNVTFFLLNTEDENDAYAVGNITPYHLYMAARKVHLTPEQKAELEARRAAPSTAGDADDPAEPETAAPGGDVSSVDTREERLDEIVDELMTGELPGMWTLMRHDGILHIGSYILDLPDEQHLMMINLEGEVNDENDRLYLRVHNNGAIIPMDEESPDYIGWMNVYGNDDPIRTALRDAAELLLDGEAADHAD